jgi:hypothetical protein
MQRYLPVQDELDLIHASREREIRETERMRLAATHEHELREASRLRSEADADAGSPSREHRASGRDRVRHPLGIPVAALLRLVR